LADLKHAVAIDSVYKDAHLALYFIYLSKSDIDLALKHIGIAARARGNDQPKLLFNAGKTALQYGKYEIALQYLKTYLDLNSKDSMTRRSAMHMLGDVQYSLSHLKEIKLFSPVIPGKINTTLPEYLPSIDAAGRKLVFTRRVHGQEDLFIAEGKDTFWNNVIPWPQNTIQNEGAHVISADGKTIVFTRCETGDGFGSCDLYISEYKNSSWTKPINLGPPINSAYWESQPSLSANGKILYFVSNRPGGQGGYDIWKSNKIGKTWSRPMNAGKSINTTWDELSPWFHADGEHLYFRSNGWPGFGSFDLFVSKKNENRTWDVPLNLGFPINDFKDQGAMAVGIDGHSAYLTTQVIDNQNALVDADIVLFNLYDQVSSFACIYIQGNVREAITGIPIPGASIIITSEVHAGRKDTVFTDRDGEYLIVLPRQDTVQFFIGADKYNFQTDRIVIDSFSKDRIQYDVSLTPISNTDSVTFSKPIVLNNVLFELSSFKLLDRFLRRTR
jgi:hypothetical protein